MDFLVAWVLYPLSLLALCAGVGLLFNVLTGRRLPGELLAPVGLVPAAIAALVAALVDGSADILLPALFVLAVAGVAFSVPLRYGRPEASVVAVGLSGFAVIAIPAIVAGESAEPLRLDLAWAFPPSLAFLTAMLALCALRLAEAGMARARKELLGFLALSALITGALVPGVLSHASGGRSAYDRLAELHQIGAEFEGQGPVLLVDDDLFGARRALGGTFEIGEAGVPDLDLAKEKDVAADEFLKLLRYRTMILRASPPGSRPFLPYKLVRDGDWYEVWQRPVEPTGPVLSHMALGGPNSPVAKPNCSEVGGLGLLALANQLGYPAQETAIVGARPDGRIVIAPPDRTEGLCGRPLDWIEAVGLKALERR